MLFTRTLHRIFVALADYIQRKGICNPHIGGADAVISWGNFHLLYSEFLTHERITLQYWVHKPIYIAWCYAYPDSMWTEKGLSRCLSRRLSQRLSDWLYVYYFKPIERVVCRFGKVEYDHGYVGEVSFLNCYVFWDDKHDTHAITFKVADNLSVCWQDHSWEKWAGVTFFAWL